MCPAISQWAHVEFFYKVPINLITMCPVGPCWALCERTPWFLSWFCLQCIQYMPEPLIESSFKKCSVMWSKCAQGVLFNVFTMNSQFGSISQQTLKEIIEYMVEYFMATSLGTFWKNSQWVAQAYTGYIVNKITKETRDFFHKVPSGNFGGHFYNVPSMYPLGTLWSNWWALCKRTQHVPTGWWLDTLFKKSQCNHNVPTG